MKKILFALSAGLFLFSSCANENSLNEKLSGKGGVREDGTTLVSVSLPDLSRTYFGAHAGSTYSVYWSGTDAIQINGANSTSITINSGNQSAAEFTIGASLSYPYRAVYPAALASGFVADSVVVTLPATQTYTAGSYDPAAGVMLGYASSGDVAFRSAMAFLKVNISGGSDSDPIVSVRVRSNIDMTGANGDYGRQSMSGAFVANFSSQGSSLVRRVNDGSSVTLNCGNGVAQGTDLYIAIPPQTYSKGINLFIVDASGHYQEILSNKSFTAEAGTVYNTEVVFNGGKSWVGPGIYTETDWNALAAQTTFNTVCEEFKDEGGTYNLYANISATSFMRFGGVQGYNSNFSGVLDGNGHSITTSKMSVPLFTHINGTVKNLTIGGSKPSINNVGWGTAMLALDLKNGALIDNVTANYTVTAPCTSTGTTKVCYFGIVRDIFAGAVMQNCTQQSSFVIPSQDKTTGDCEVLTFAEDNAGMIKDCTNSGNITVANAMPQKVICAGVLTNTGTIEGFTNTGNFSLNSAVGVAAAGVAVFGGGYIHNCTNGESGKGSTKGVISVTASPSADGKAFRVAGIAAYGDGDDSGNCGRFYGCTNHGNLTLYKGTTSRIYRSSVGGIVADIRFGAYSSTENNSYCTFDSCSNKGYLSLLEPQTNATTSNAGSLFLGGILGVALNNSGTSTGYIVLSKTTSELAGPFLVIRASCSNTGTLEFASASPSPSSASISGARLNYVGGIAGFTYGIGNTNTSGSSNAHYAVVRGSQNGIIKLGSSVDGNVAAGGIVGGCCYTKVEQAVVTKVDYRATEELTAGKAPVYRGILGAVIGWVVKYSNVGAASAGVNATMEDNTGLKCSTSSGFNSSDVLIGYAGITGASSKHRGDAEKHRIEIYGSPTFNGNTVTTDMIYGGGNITVH